MILPLKVIQPVSLRPPLSSDEAFLYALYASTRAAEWARLDLPESEKESLMEMQFRGQSRSYTSQFPHSEHSIVLSNGEPAGRTWLNEGPDEIKVLDIAILPRFQRQGIGAQLMTECQRRARMSAKPLRHSVLRWNAGAIAFYIRLGFVPYAEEQFFLQLEWRP